MKVWVISKKLLIPTKEERIEIATTDLFDCLDFEEITEFVINAIHSYPIRNEDNFYMEHNAAKVRQSIRKSIYAERFHFTEEDVDEILKTTYRILSKKLKKRIIGKLSMVTHTLHDLGRKILITELGRVKKIISLRFKNYPEIMEFHESLKTIHNEITMDITFNIVIDFYLEYRSRRQLGIALDIDMLQSMLYRALEGKDRLSETSFYSPVDDIGTIFYRLEKVINSDNSKALFNRFPPEYDVLKCVLKNNEEGLTLYVG